MEKQYYIVSAKHTSKGDKVLTLWGPNSAGYTWHRDRAGVYSEEDKEKAHHDDQNIFVDKELADTLWMEAEDYGDKYIALPNDTTVRTVLDIPTSGMKPTKYKSPGKMKFIKRALLIAFLFLGGICQAQKTHKVEGRNLKLFTFNFYKKSSHKFRDTTEIIVTLGHKTNKNYVPSSYQGYLVTWGRKKRFYLCDFQPIPLQYYVKSYYER